MESHQDSISISLDMLHWKYIVLFFSSLFVPLSGVCPTDLVGWPLHCSLEVFLWLPRPSFEPQHQSGDHRLPWKRVRKTVDKEGVLGRGGDLYWITRKEREEGGYQVHPLPDLAVLERIEELTQKLKEKGRFWVSDKARIKRSQIQGNFWITNYCSVCAWGSG